jgi:hypothetical protein
MKNHARRLVLVGALAVVCGSAFAQSAGGGYTPLPQSTGRAAYSTTILTAQQYQPLFTNQSPMTKGCWIHNPTSSGATIYVDWAGAQGTVLQGTSEEVVQGATVKCDVNYSNTITVYSFGTPTFEAGLN